LIRLQLVGWFRSIRRSLRTVKGAGLALLGLLLFLGWLGPLLYQSSQGMDAAERVELDQRVLLYGPGMLLLYCLVQVLLTTEERTIYFTPAEVQFLFSGPFSRRQILLYKIAWSFLFGLPSTLILTLLLRRYAEWFPAALVGVVLMTLFMQLFRMALNLLTVSVGAQLYSRGRKLLLVAALVVGVVTVGQIVGWSPADWQSRDFLKAMQETTAWKTVTLPISWFFQAFLAKTATDLIAYTALGLAVDLALLGLVLGLDAHYLEAAAAASARTYAQLQRVRRGGLAGTTPSGGKARFRVPMPPWWGGVGPIFWRQMTTALRGLGRLAFALFFFGIFLAGPLLAAVGERGDGSQFGTVLGIAVLWLTVFLTPLLPFDFRGDVDRMAVLKTLPIRPWRLAVGQMLTPVLLATLMQWALLSILGLLEVWRRWNAADLSGQAFLDPDVVILLACFAFAFPFNFLLFGVENLLFLLFPTRVMATAPGDFQAMGRNLVYTLAKLMTLGMATFAAVLVGGVVFWLTGENLSLSVLAAWPVVVVFAAGLLPLIALAFRSFDVTRDAPV
jgi:hypothetical protein